MKIRNLIATAVLTVAFATAARAQQASQYLASHITNAQVTVLEGNITKTNLQTLSSFRSSAAQRYTQLDFDNVSATAVYGIFFGSAGSGVFTNSQTNAVYSAGGFRLEAAGTAGSKKSFNLTIPKNGPANGGSITVIFQGGTGDAGSNTTAKVNVGGYGF